MTKSYDDLTIDELLDDPLTHAIMRADRVNPAELRAMLRALAAPAARSDGRPSDGDRDGDDAPSGRNAAAPSRRSTGRDGGETSRRVATRSGLQPQFHPQVCSAR
jgi:hypothetical protein